MNSSTKDTIHDTSYYTRRCSKDLRLLMPLNDSLCSQEQYLVFQKKILEKEMQSGVASPEMAPQATTPSTPSPMRRFRTALDRSRNGLNKSRNGLMGVLNRSRNGLNKSRNGLDGSRNGMNRSRNGMNRSRNGVNRSRNGMDNSRNGMDRSWSGLSPQDEGTYDNGE